tara:strand:- start:749 stop:1048 length:300 start_codon:yes stop_codon:yes gene_type:complete
LRLHRHAFTELARQGLAAAGDAAQFVVVIAHGAQRGACQQAAVWAPRQCQITGQDDQAVIVVAEARTIGAVDAALAEPEVGVPSLLFSPVSYSQLWKRQ